MASNPGKKRRVFDSIFCLLPFRFSIDRMRDTAIKNEIAGKINPWPEVAKNLWRIYGKMTFQTNGSDYYISRPMISVIGPFYNEEANVAALYTQLSRVRDTVGKEWELVCVNDDSRDNTLAELLALQQRDSRVRVIELSRRFSKEATLTAGLDYARSEVAITLDADLQDPPEVIPLLLRKWREGYEVVNAVRASRGRELPENSGNAPFLLAFSPPERG